VVCGGRGEAARDRAAARYRDPRMRDRVLFRRRHERLFAGVIDESIYSPVTR
jgi:hypothetical protein